MTQFPAISYKILLPVGDGRKMVFTVLAFDGTLALLSSDSAGENIKQGKKLCYRLNGKEKIVFKSQLSLV